MPIKILMPALSPTMTEGNLAKWLKNEGDTVEAGEVIAEIETDKATMEVEAVDEGVLKKILVPAGSENIAVNSLIAVLLEEDEDDSNLEEFIKQSQVGSPTVESETTKPEDVNQGNLVESATGAADLNTDKANSVAKVSGGNKITSSADNAVSGQKQDGGNNIIASPKNHYGERVFASPLAKRIAAEEGVNLANIEGTGPHGRIVKSDVLANSRGARSGIVRSSQEYRLQPNNNMRKVIAKRLLESKQKVPHFYLNIECQMDAILDARVQINSQIGEDKSKRISVNDFVILASAKALRDVPEANSSWTDDAIRIYNNVDVSVAVAIDGGLITPIIKNADQKQITDISAEMKDLAKRAREGSLAPEEYQGGGFSISNLGMYGIKNFNAIINPPQSAILAVGQSNKRAIVKEGKIEVATMMDVSLSCDHRVVDGAVGANFLAAFKKYIESPILLFIAN